MAETQGNRLKAMMAQLQGQLQKPAAPKPRVNAEPQFDEQSRRGVGPTPGKVKGIDDVDTREGTASEIAELAQKAKRTGPQEVPELEEAAVALGEDPGLADALESEDSGSADLAPVAAALEEEPEDPMEATTVEAAVTRPKEDAGTKAVEAAIEDSLAEPDEAVVSGAEVESVPPSSMEALEGEAEEEQERQSAATVSAVAAVVMEQMGAMVDEKLSPLRKQLEELKGSIEATLGDVNERMGKLAEDTLGMETFNAFFTEDFAPVLEAVEKVDAMSGQVDRIEEELKGVNKELSGDEGVVVRLSKELDALRTRVENETVSSEMWNTFLEEEYLPVAELRDQLEELDLPALAKAWAELSVKWDALVGPEGERIPGMVHAHREASVVVAVEILRNTDEHNFHRLQDFVGDYGKEWVAEVMGYLAENPEVVRDKVALAKYNVIYEHMAASTKLQSYKPKVDAEVQKVLGFAKQLTAGDS